MSQFFEQFKIVSQQINISLDKIERSYKTITKYFGTDWFENHKKDPKIITNVLEMILLGESISAVEAISKVISGDSKAELGQTLKLIENNIGLHPALKKGFLAIYGYTSDADGIRHAMINEPKCDFEDAKYMLVSCSAFINYLIMKATKARII